MESNQRIIAETIPKASAVMLFSLLAIIFYTISSVLDVYFHDRDAINAKQGVLDLSSSSVQHQHSLPLNGEWQFAWQQLYSPDKASLSDELDYEIVTTPHSWENNYAGETPISLYGFGTYKLTVIMPQKFERLAISIPPIGSAFELYVDGKLLTTGGKVARDKETSEPDYQPGIVEFTPVSDRIDVRVNVSNHDLYWAGLWYPIRISTPPIQYNEQLLNMLRSGSIMTILLTIAIFNLIQFTQRPKDILPFVIASTCILIALREAETSQILNITQVVKLSWDTYVRISFLSFYIAGLGFTLYFHLSFPKEFHNKVMYAFYLLSGVFTLVVLFTPSSFFNHTMLWYQLAVLLLIPYMCWRLYYVFERKRFGAKFVILGTFVMFSFVLHDIFLNLGFIDSTFMVSFGLVVFALCQSYITTLRFIHATEENAALAETLALRNKEIEDFSESIEHHSSRSDQLEKENQQLEVLAYRDALTGLPNRRGMLPSAQQAMSQNKARQVPCSLLLLDFDNFKQINDQYGHECGDTVLKSGAYVMKNALRDQDLVARWGGEEFLILLPSTAVSGATIIADKLRETLKELVSEDVGFQVTVTIGIASVGATETFEQAFKRADKALYRGKDAGRDRVKVADEETPA